MDAAGRARQFPDRQRRERPGVTPPYPRLDLCQPSPIGTLICAGLLAAQEMQGPLREAALGGFPPGSDGGVRRDADL